MGSWLESGTILRSKFIPQALSQEDWQDGEPTEAEKDFWELASLECYDHLTMWKSLEYCATVNIDSGKPPDLNKTWNDPFFQVFRNYFVDIAPFLSLQGCSTVLRLWVKISRVVWVTLIWKLVESLIYFKKWNNYFCLLFLMFNFYLKSMADPIGPALSSCSSFCKSFCCFSCFVSCFKLPNHIF